MADQDMQNRSTGSIKIKLNIRDGIDEDDCLVDSDEHEAA